MNGDFLLFNELDIGLPQDQRSFTFVSRSPSSRGVRTCPAAQIPSPGATQVGGMLIRVPGGRWVGEPKK